MDTHQENKIVVNIPRPPITSLVFEGGGVKGIAYVGAYRVLKEKKGLLDHVHWVAGSSAGAMVALMVALNFTPDEIEAELTAVNFSEFAESLPQGKLATINYIFKNSKKIGNNINHGINHGKELYLWIQRLVEKKLGNKQATFFDLKPLDAKQNLVNQDISIASPLAYKNLHVVVTNAKKNKSEILSWETTPNMQIADAVLASMSIPGFFYLRYIDTEMRKIDWNPTAEKIDSQTIVPYLDGGVLNNYPINIFLTYPYWVKGYYGIAKTHRFNPCSLGIRVDSKEDVINLIEIRRQLELLDRPHSSSKESVSHEQKKTASSPDDWIKPKSDVLSMARKLLNLLTSDLNKVEQYAKVTLGIDDCNIHTTQFNLTERNKYQLKESGKKSANAFLNEYLKEGFFKRIIYSNPSELEKTLKNNMEALTLLKASKNEGLFKHGFESLEFITKLLTEKLSAPNTEPTVPTLFFASSSQASTSGAGSAIPADSCSIDITKIPEAEIQEVPLSERETSRTQDSVTEMTSQKPSINTMESEQRSIYRQFCFCL